MTRLLTISWSARAGPVAITRRSESACEVGSLSAGRSACQLLKADKLCESRPPDVLASPSPISAMLRRGQRRLTPKLSLRAAKLYGLTLTGCRVRAKRLLRGLMPLHWRGTLQAWDTAGLSYLRSRKWTPKHCWRATRCACSRRPRPAPRRGTAGAHAAMRMPSATSPELRDPWLAFLADVDRQLRQPIAIDCLGGFVAALSTTTCLVPPMISITSRSSHTWRASRTRTGTAGRSTR